MGSNQFFIMFVLVVTLGGCGAVDGEVHFLPKTFKQPAHEVELEQPPDVDAILRKNTSAVFTAAASPSNISMSFPVPAKYGGWTTCVKATAQGITGRSLGTQTYLVHIEHNQIGSREHVDNNHWCVKEIYQPL
jgi:hypothetical protein